MMKKKIMSLFLCLCLILAMAVSASAAEIQNDGGSGTTQVLLDSTVDGSIDGEPAATAMSVTIPTALPMAMNQAGVVTTASDAKITNLSYGPVRVRTVDIEAGKNWHLTAFGASSTLASEKVDSNQIGFAMTIGGGSQIATTSASTTQQQLLAAPQTGCYMSGVGDPSRNSVEVLYEAIVTPLSEAAVDANVANVVFVVEWDK